MKKSPLWGLLGLGLVWVVLILMEKSGDLWWLAIAMFDLGFIKDIGPQCIQLPVQMANDSIGPLLHHFLNQVFLGWEVVVDAGRFDPRLISNFSHGGGGVALHAKGAGRKL